MDENSREMVSKRKRQKNKVDQEGGTL